MDIIHNENIDRSILICGKNETYRGLIELLFESGKRSGGGEIEIIDFNKNLSQYLIVYAKVETVDNVLQFGTVNFHDTEYVPHRIDKKKLIIENVDDKLEKDVLCLYADNLLQDIDDVEFNIVNLRNRCIMLFFNKEYNIDSIKHRFKKHDTIQKRKLKLHLVPKIKSSEDLSLNSNELLSLYSYIYGNPIETASENPKTSNSENKCKSALILIQDDDKVKNPISATDSPLTSKSAISDLSTDKEFLLQNRITLLENKLQLVETVNTLYRLDRANECANCSNKQDSNKITTSDRNNNLISTLSADIDLATLGTHVLNLNENASSIQPNTSYSKLPVGAIPSRDYAVKFENRQVENPSQTSNTEASNESEDFENTRKKTFENLLKERGKTLKKSIGQRLIDDNREAVRPLVIVKRESNFRNNCQNSDPTEISQRESTSTVSNDNIQRSNLSSTTAPEALKHQPVSRQIPFSSFLRRSRAYNNTSGLNRNFFRNVYNEHANMSGLSQGLIDRFPIIKYQKPKTAGEDNSNAFELETDTGENATNSSRINDCINATNMCSICLDEFEDTQDVRLLSCFHQFHVRCIDQWLTEKPFCPSCKLNLHSTFENETNFPN